MVLLDFVSSVLVFCVSDTALVFVVVVVGANPLLLYLYTYSYHFLMETQVFILFGTKNNPTAL